MSKAASVPAGILSGQNSEPPPPELEPSPELPEPLTSSVSEGVLVKLVIESADEDPEAGS
jgi:hypothetical protein